jgi:hypothetical protein
VVQEVLDPDYGEWRVSTGKGRGRGKERTARTDAKNQGQVGLLGDGNVFPLGAAPARRQFLRLDDEVSVAAEHSGQHQ